MFYKKSKRCSYIEESCQTSLTMQEVSYHMRYELSERLHLQSLFISTHTGRISLCQVPRCFRAIKSNTSVPAYASDLQTSSGINMPSQLKLPIAIESTRTVSVPVPDQLRAAKHPCSHFLHRPDVAVPCQTPATAESAPSPSAAVIRLEAVSFTPRLNQRTAVFFALKSMPV